MKAQIPFFEEMQNDRISLKGKCNSLKNILLASCPWGPATVDGVGLLTEMYAIYIERYSSHEGRRSNGPTFLRPGNMDGSLGNIYGFYYTCRQSF